jgi:hypothetical protein
MNMAPKFNDWRPMIDMAAKPCKRAITVSKDECQNEEKG